MRVVSADEMRSHLNMGALIEAFRAGHRRAAPEVARVLLEQGDNSFLVWHAWQPDDRIVVKMATIFPANVPSVQGTVAVFDARTGVPTAVLDGTELTYWKTAASSGLAASILAPSSATTLLMVGAGGLAPYLIRAHRAARPSIERVLVWNRTRARAVDLGIGEVVDDLEAAVGLADVISCATPSTAPLVLGAWLKPDTHLDLVGSYTPAMREVDDEAIRRSSLFVDSVQFNIDHCGDLCQPIADGVCQRSDIRDLYSLCAGPAFERSSITLFKSGGGAHLDLMAACHVLDS